jgi:hypothetical protein
MSSCIRPIVQHGRRTMKVCVTVTGVTTGPAAAAAHVGAD